MSDTNKAATLSVDIDSRSAEEKLNSLRAAYAGLQEALGKPSNDRAIADIGKSAKTAAAGVEHLDGAVSLLGKHSSEIVRLATEVQTLGSKLRNAEALNAELHDKMSGAQAQAKQRMVSYATDISGVVRKAQADINTLGSTFISTTDRQLAEMASMAKKGFDTRSWAAGYKLDLGANETEVRKFESFVRRVREAKKFLNESDGPETTTKRYGSSITDHIARLDDYEARLRSMRSQKDATPAWKSTRELWFESNGDSGSLVEALRRQREARQLAESAAADNALATRGERGLEQRKYNEGLAKRNKAIVAAHETANADLVKDLNASSKDNAAVAAALKAKQDKQNAELLAATERSTQEYVEKARKLNERRIAQARKDAEALAVATERFALSTPKQQASTVYKAAMRIEKGRDVSLMAPEAVSAAQELGSATAAKSALDALYETKKKTASASSTLASQTKLSAEQQRHWNTLANDGHAAARGLSGALGGLWMTYGSIAPLVATAAMAGALKQVFSIGKELEFQFTMISAISNGAVVDMDKFNKAIAGTMFTPVEAAKGLRVMAQAGLSAEEALTSLPAVLKLATVGETDMANAALSATAIMHSFGLSVNDMGHIGDVFAKAAAISATSVTEMMEAMKQASAVSDMFGVKMEETAAALATLANRGIEGSAAGTALRNMVKELASPVTDKAKFAMKSLGIEVHNADGSAKSFTENLEQLAEAVSTMSAKGKAKFLEDLFNERGVKAANILLTDLDKLKKSLSEVKEASDGLGFMSEARIKINLSTEGMLKTLKSDFQRVLGETFKSIEPEVKQVIVSLSEVINSPEFKGAIVSLAETVAGLTKFITEHTEAIKVMVAAYLSLKTIQVGGAALAFIAKELSNVYVGLKAITTLNIAGTVAAQTAAVAAGASTASAAMIGVASGTGAAATAMGNLSAMIAGSLGGFGLAAAGITAIGVAAYVAYNKITGFSESYAEMKKQLDRDAFNQGRLVEEVKRGESALDAQNTVLREQIRLMREGVGAADALAQAEKNLALSAARNHLTKLQGLRNQVPGNAESPNEEDFDKSATAGGARISRIQTSNQLADINRQIEAQEKVVAELETRSGNATTLAGQNAAMQGMHDRIKSAQNLNKELSETIRLGDEAAKKLASGVQMTPEHKKRLEAMVTQGNKVKNLAPLPTGERGGEIADQTAIELRKGDLQGVKNDYQGKEKKDRGAEKDFRTIQNDKLASGLKQLQLGLDREKIKLDIEVADQTIRTSEALRQKNVLTEQEIAAERKLIESLLAEAKAMGDKVQISKLENDLDENAIKMAKQKEQSLLNETQLRRGIVNAIEDTMRSTRRYIEDLDFERQILGKTALEVANLRIERERLRAIEDVDRREKRGEIEPQVADQERSAILRKEEAQKKDADYRTSFVGGWQLAFDEYQRAASNSATAARSIFETMSRGMEDAFMRFVTTGKLGFKDFVNSVIAEAARAMANKAVAGLLAKIGTMAMGAVSGGGGYDAWTGGGGAGATGISPEGQLWNANGNVFSGAPSLHQYVNTVQTSPKTFAFDNLHKYAKGGVFAEAGPEAVMPLTRDSSGRLGVYAQGGNAGGSMVMINIEVHEGDGGSNKEESRGDAEGTWRQFAGRVKGLVLEEIDNQKRPGGRLYARG